VWKQVEPLKDHRNLLANRDHLVADVIDALAVDRDVACIVGLQTVNTTQ